MLYQIIASNWFSKLVTLNSAIVSQRELLS